MESHFVHPSLRSLSDRLNDAAQSCSIWFEPNETERRHFQMKRVLVNPKETQPMYDAFHFSQANRVGDTIWVSGQVGVDSNLSPARGMAAQARLAFEGLKRTLAETGASLEDVVELTTFHIDLRGEMDEFAKVKDEFFPRDYPAWTAVGVTQLALPELRVEVRAVAIAGSGKE
jgi:enamine deaminase RidA (YjgF/YER057c/UK114 family)